MLQRRGCLTSMNALATVAAKLQQQFAQRVISFNLHLTLIQAPISFFSVTKEL